MRIIAGSLKGRRVEPVPSDGTRPTTDRVREAIASSVISNHEGGFEGANVLDAFAGSGAMGIEAFSRGAASCAFIDESPKAVKTVEANLASLPIPKGSARVLRMDTFSMAGEEPARDGQAASTPARALPGSPYDIVFLDPPYETDHRRVAALVDALAQTGQLAHGALAVYERSGGKGGKGKTKKKRDERGYPEAEEMAGMLGDAFELVSVKSYGAVQVVYLAYRGNE